MSIVGLTGYAGAGKDTAALALVEDGWERMAFADPMREMMLTLDPIACGNEDDGMLSLSDLVAILGWDRAKRDYPEVRRLLQVFGTEVVRNNFGRDAWVNIARERMVPGVDYVFTDCRFPNEVEMIHRAGGLVIRIDRPGVEAVNAHASDDIMGLNADFWISNESTIEYLHHHLRELVS